MPSYTLDDFSSGKNHHYAETIKVHIELEAPICWIRLDGALTQNTLFPVKTAILQNFSKPEFRYYALDLTQVYSMDSSGIGCISSLSLKFRKANRQLVICGANRTVSLLLDITAINQVIDVFADADSLRAKFSA